MPVPVKLSDITLDDRLQMRAAMDDDAIAEYSECLVDLPPGKIVLDTDGHMFLTGGWHSYKAHEAKHAETMLCEVREGTFRDAILEAAGENHGHGIKRTPEDKRKAVAALLADEEWAANSDRWIADICHVGQHLVADVRNAPVSGARARTSTKRKGKDGKKYAAPAKVFCERCARIGVETPPGCVKCKEARKKVEAEKRKKAADKKKKESSQVDPYGVAVPKGRLGAWQDPWIDNTLTTLGEVRQKFLAAKFANGMDKRKKHYPFFRPADFIDGTGFVMQYLDQMIEHLEENAPHAVCPKCAGKGCEHCRASGLVSESLYKALS